MTTGCLTSAKFLLRFRGRTLVEVLVSPGRERICCWPVDSKKDWLDVGPGSRVHFPARNETLTVESVGLFSSLPTIVGTGHGLSLHFRMTGRELLERIESGELVEWGEVPPVLSERGLAASRSTA